MVRVNDIVSSVHVYIARDAPDTPNSATRLGRKVLHFLTHNLLELLLH